MIYIGDDFSDGMIEVRLDQWEAQALACALLAASEDRHKEGAEEGRFCDTAAAFFEVAGLAARLATEAKGKGKPAA